MINLITPVAFEHANKLTILHTNICKAIDKVSLSFQLGDKLRILGIIDTLFGSGSGLYSGGLT